MMRKSILAGAVIFSLFLFAGNQYAAETDIIGKPAPNFTLENGKGKRITLSKKKGTVILLVFGGREAANERTRWREAVNEKFLNEKDFQAFSVISFTKGAPKMLVRRLHKNEPSLFDWDMKITHQYKVGNADKPNIFLINREGVVMHKWVDNYSEQGLKEIEKKVGELLVQK